jgi:hypothetical protein
MNLQSILTAIFVAGWAVAFGSGIFGTYYRIKAWRGGLLSPYRRKYHISIFTFLCGWAVAMGTGLLADHFGYVR